MILVPKEVLRNLLLNVVGEMCTTRSYDREAVECGDCGSYNVEDGWCSTVEHRYDCPYLLNKKAKEDLMFIMNKVSNEKSIR